MKKILFLILAMAAAINCYAQTKPDSITIEGSIPVIRTDPAEWMERYDATITAYEQENRTMEDMSCDVLLLGSSTLVRWETVHEDLSPMKVIRRSYGGSTVRDQIYNYDIVAKGYNPKQILIYIANDIVSSKTGISVGESYDLFRVFIGKLKEDYPQTTIHIISMLPSFSRANMLESQKMLNKLFEEYARRTPNVNYIDATPAVSPGGELQKDRFVEDNLHLNKKGYEELAKIVRPVLLEYHR